MIAQENEIAIRHAAIDYDRDVEGSSSVREAFADGARWAYKRISMPWISVKARMPGKYKPVVVCTETYGEDGISREWYSAFWNGNAWISIGYNVANAQIGAKVTHWMYAPLLPETNDNNQPQQLNLF